MEFASSHMPQISVEAPLGERSSDYTMSFTLRTQDLASQVPPRLELSKQPGDGHSIASALYMLREAPAMTVGLRRRPDGQDLW